MLSALPAKRLGAAVDGGGTGGQTVYQEDDRCLLVWAELFGGLKGTRQRFARWGRGLPEDQIVRRD